MTTTINASPSNGLVQTADGSGILKVQSNGVTTNALAWVNFNGSTAAIRANYNIGSVTKNSTGDYTLNFTSALPDANYVLSGAAGLSGNGYILYFSGATAPSTSSLRINVVSTANAVADVTYVTAAIFGN